MEKLKHDLLTDKYTTVYHEPKNEMNYNAPHRFIVAIRVQCRDSARAAC